ncbi:MAG: hypothetical protein ACRYF7_03275 [Janthinobacterium lividum]
MTVSTPVATDKPVVAPQKPISIELIGPAVTIMQELCAHVRNGYTVHKDYPMHFYQNGNISLMLIIGNPDDYALKKAQESTDASIAREQAEYNRRVQEEAKLLVERQAREALEKSVAEAVAAHEKQIAKLKRDAEAELARLNK